jgi:hypothetical protein
LRIVVGITSNAYFRGAPWLAVTGGVMPIVAA